MFTKKVPLFYFLIAIVLSFACTYFIMARTSSMKLEKVEAENDSLASSSDACAYNIKRESGYKFVRPLLFAERNCQSDNLLPLKGDIAAAVEGLKGSGIVSSVSVYVRLFKRGGEWICYNDGETFNPGSLIKVPVLITYLRQAEDDPGLLDKQITYPRPSGVVPHQTFSSKTLEPGRSYTIRELLHYMIAYSDNEATNMLHKNLDIKAFKKTFTDLGLKEPNPWEKNFQISATDFSTFIKALFNASYLTRKNSEFAVSLMADCDFKEGIAKGLPPGTIIAHKFGEGGTDTLRELHESALVYLNNTRYLITIMSKGKNVRQLPEVLSRISRVVYDDISKQQSL